MKTQRMYYAPTRSRRLNEILGIAVLVGAGLLLLSILTYNPADPSWNTVGGGAPHRPAHNWTGLTGAFLADLLLQSLGIACLGLPVALARVGLSWLKSRPVGSGWMKTGALLLWLAFAPAGLAMLAPRALWYHALPIGGVEGRLLSDAMIHAINPPGAAIVCGLMVALSFYLSTSFMVGSAQEWFRTHARWMSWSRLTQWRAFRRMPKSERAALRAEMEREAEAAHAAVHGEAHAEESWGEPAQTLLHPPAFAFTGAIDPSVAHAGQEEEAEPRTSLLASFFGFFGRRNRPDTELHATPEPSPELEESMWESLPRTRTDDAPATSLGTAAAAAAPFAAQLAAAATPLRGPGTDPSFEIGFSQQPAHDSWEEPRIPVRRDPVASREDDGWLDAPERQTFQPMLGKNRPPAPFEESRALADAHAFEPQSNGEAANESIAEPIARAPQLVQQPLQRDDLRSPRIAPPMQRMEFIPEPVRETFREPVHEMPRPIAQAPAPRPMPTQQPARQAAPMPPQRPAPSPMADLREQNIAFGERADAHAVKNFQPVKSIDGYKLPPSSLLHQGQGQQSVDEDLLRDEARTLVEKFAEFGVAGRVEQINPGPVVTTFEFRPEAGVKVAKIMGLSDDLCLAMAAESVLIERMPGKSTVGIQVPNSDRETIWLRDVVENPSFSQTRSRLPLALGKDIDGNIVVTDLAAMPHVLIAGSTGSGKSVAINAMIMSVLYRNTPEQVRMILVDPKRVELGMYEGIPHLFTPIITEAKLAANALKNAVKEMERRLKLLAANHVRNIDQFNKLFEYGSGHLFEDVNQEPLPYIIIVIDELADLMMLDRANVEEAITRLAQMARAVGIHLVLATQRPSVDVITGLLKANVPTRMSFRLATKVDSRTIIDTNGAESLLGRGDMLFLPPGTSRLQRVHAPFVTEKEISAVTDFWRAQGTAEYAEGFLEGPKEDKVQIGEAGASDGENDPLFDDAVRLVFEFGKASTSLLQRRLRIGYGRAASLIDLMERDGLVGPADGSKPRELLKPANYFAEMDAAVR